jgi:hypothetical protein
MVEKAVRDRLSEEGMNEERVSAASLEARKQADFLLGLVLELNEDVRLNELQSTAQLRFLLAWLAWLEERYSEHGVFDGGTWASVGAQPVDARPLLLRFRYRRLAMDLSRSSGRDRSGLHSRRITRMATAWYRNVPAAGGPVLPARRACSRGVEDQHSSAKRLACGAAGVGRDVRDRATRAMKTAAILLPASCAGYFLRI